VKKLATFAMAAVIFASTGAFAIEITDLMPVLKQAKKDVNFTLSEIDKDLEAAAKALSNVDFKGDDARKILNDLRKFRPYVVDCCIIDPSGMKVTVEPEEYRQYENTDRSGLPYIIQLLKTKKPAMSDVHPSAEGISAVSVGRPIFSSKGELLGAVRVLIKQEMFLKPLVGDKLCKIWIMQPNGFIIYDPDPKQVGKNVFTDPVYESFEDLISFSKTVALSNSGAGSYDFYAKGLGDNKLVKKVAVWDTVGLYGTEWRMIAMEIQEAVMTKPAQNK